MRKQYINLDFIAGRTTGTCCWGCTNKDDCPMESLGRRCTRDHTTCQACTWWNERGCAYFQFDRSFLRM
jgi:hypothetical protein